MKRTPSSDVDQRQSAYQHELYLLLANVGVQQSYEHLSQLSRQSNCIAAEDECRNVIKTLDRVLEICNLCGGQCITLKGTALFCLGNKYNHLVQCDICHTGVAYNKLFGDGVMTGEPLHEVASKYVECLLTIQPASIAHMGLVL